MIIICGFLFSTTYWSPLIIHFQKITCNTSRLFNKLQKLGLINAQASLIAELTSSTPLARQMQARKRSCAFLASLSSSFAFVVTQKWPQFRRTSVVSKLVYS